LIGRPVMLAVALRFVSDRGRTSTFAALRTPQPLYYVLQRSIPAGDRRKRSRVSISHMATLTFECEHVLPKIVGELDDR
jgi:hypothetical protein